MAKVSGIIPSFTNVVSVQYVRWSVTATKTTANLMQASEFVLRLGETNISMTGTTVTASAANQTGEIPANLVDNNTATKYCSTTTTGPWTFTFNLGSVKVFNGYRWSTANDAEARDPSTWTIGISTDNINWRTMHTITGFVATATRLTSAGTWVFNL